MKNKPGVYKITNLINGKIYIGSSNNIARRFIQHRYNGSNKGTKNSRLYEDMRNLGIENFAFEIIEFTDNYREREKVFIEKLHPYYNKQKDTYNNMDNPNTKQKHRDVLKSEAYREKIKKTHGFTKKESFKKAASERSKKWWKDNYEEGCRKSREAQSSPEYRKKRSEMAQAYKPLNREHQPNRRPIIMLDDNKNELKRFLSILEAVEYLRENGFPKATDTGVRKGGEGGYRYKHYWKFE